MTTPPTFSVGQYNTAAYMNSIGMWKVTPASVTNGSVSNGVATFTGQTTVSLNGIFSADYDNYVLESRIYGNSLSFAKFRLRASGTDATGTNYFRYGYYTVYTSGTVTAYNAGSETSWSAFTAYGNAQQYPGISTVSIQNPFLAAYRTTMNVNINNAYYAETYGINGLHETAASYDGITVFANAGTMTGEIRVYGIRN